MNELELAKRFSDDIDRILNDSKAVSTTVKSDDKCYQEAIELGRILAKMDLSRECRISEELRQRLLDRISPKQWVGDGKDSAELDDDDLDNVAGGIDHHRDFQREK